MQEEARKEMTSGDSEERFDTYNEYYKLVDVVQKAALDELKVRSILENYGKQQAEALCAEAAALESSDKPVKKSSTKLPE